jgi:hypothetical protein
VRPPAVSGSRPRRLDPQARGVRPKPGGISSRLSFVFLCLCLLPVRESLASLWCSVAESVSHPRCGVDAGLKCPQLRLLLFRPLWYRRFFLFSGSVPPLSDSVIPPGWAPCGVACYWYIVHGQRCFLTLLGRDHSAAFCLLGWFACVLFLLFLSLSLLGSHVRRVVAGLLWGR